MECVIVVGSYLEGVMYVIDGCFYSEYAAEQYLEKNPVEVGLSTTIVDVKKDYDWDSCNV